MANAKGNEPAYIVMGVRCYRDGRKKLLGLNRHIDESEFQRQINTRLDNPIEFSYEVLSYKNKLFGVIRVSPSARRPHKLIKDFHNLRRQVVYTRRGSSNAEASDSEMEEMYLSRTSARRGVSKHTKADLDEYKYLSSTQKAEKLRNDLQAMTHDLGARHYSFIRVNRSHVDKVSFPLRGQRTLGLVGFGTNDLDQAGFHMAILPLECLHDPQSRHHVTVITPKGEKQLTSSGRRKISLPEKVFQQSPFVLVFSTGKVKYAWLNHRARILPDAEIITRENWGVYWEAVFPTFQLPIITTKIFAIFSEIKSYRNMRESFKRFLTWAEQKLVYDENRSTWALART